MIVTELLTLEDEYFNIEIAPIDIPFYVCNRCVIGNCVCAGVKWRAPEENYATSDGIVCGRTIFIFSHTIGVFNINLKYFVTIISVVSNYKSHIYKIVFLSK